MSSVTPRIPTGRRCSSRITDECASTHITRPSRLHPTELLSSPHSAVEDRERLPGCPLFVIGMNDREPEVWGRRPLGRRVPEHCLDMVGDEIDPLRSGVGLAPCLPHHAGNIGDDLFETPTDRDSAAVVSLSRSAARRCSVTSAFTATAPTTRSLSTIGAAEVRMKTSSPVSARRAMTSSTTASPRNAREKGRRSPVNRFACRRGPNCELLAALVAPHVQVLQR